MLGHLGMHHDHLLPHHAYLKNEIPVAGVRAPGGDLPVRQRPGTSVLDVDCKAHELDNLYVVDTSFFPSIGAVNPALTAMANALRVGDHLLRAHGRVDDGRLGLRGDGMSAEKRHVVIVGGGFAGLGCARRLGEHDDVTVTLIDRNNYHQFQPLLYQVATSQLAPSDIANSLRDVFADQDNVDVKLAEITSVDTASRTVRSSDGGEWTGDALVLAAGSQPNFFGTPGAAEYAFPLYSLDDATRLRSRILGLFEQVDRNPKLVDRGALNFVIVGGGPTGVEVAGAIADMVSETAPAEYRGFDAAARSHPPARLRRRAAEAVLRYGAWLRVQGAGGQGRRDPPRNRRQGGAQRPCGALRRGAAADPLRGLGRRHQGGRGGGRRRPGSGTRRTSRRTAGLDAQRRRRRVRHRRRRQHPGLGPRSRSRSWGRWRCRAASGPRTTSWPTSTTSGARTSPTTTRGSWR